MRSRRRRPVQPLIGALPATLLAVALAPAPALAGTAFVAYEPLESRGGGETSTFGYRAAPGERNDVTIQFTAAGRYVVRDSAGVTAGPGCEPATTQPATTVVCTERAADEVGDVTIALGDGDDRLVLRGAPRGRDAPGSGAVVTDDGPGADTVAGGDGPDELRNGPGDDILSGGRSDDVFVAAAGADGRDTFRGGAGHDVADYGARRSTVRADLAGDRDDGRRGERDTVAGDVEGLRGGRGADRLTGGARADDLRGGPGDDRLSGGGGADRLDGGTGSDLLAGGSGNDHLEGEEGRDVLTGGPGRDDLDGGAAVDTVRARDGARDTVRCHARRQRPEDRLLIDRADRFSGCLRLPGRHATLVGAGDGAAPGTEEFGQELDAPDDPVLLEIGCPLAMRARCRGSARLEWRGEVLARATFSVAPGWARTVEAPLTSAARRHAEREEVLRGAVVLATRDRAGTLRVRRFGGFGLVLLEQG